MIIVQYLGV